MHVYSGNALAPRFSVGRACSKNYPESRRDGARRVPVGRGFIPGTIPTNSASRGKAPFSALQFIPVGALKFGLHSGELAGHLEFGEKGTGALQLLSPGLGVSLPAR